MMGIGVSNGLLCSSLPGLRSNYHQQCAPQKLVALGFGLQFSPKVPDGWLTGRTPAWLVGRSLVRAQPPT
jgi:hypothetical protein